MDFLEHYVLVVIEKDGHKSISTIYDFAQDQQIYLNIIREYQLRGDVFLPWENRTISFACIRTINFLPCTNNLNTEKLKQRLAGKSPSELKAYGELYGKTCEQNLTEFQYALRKISRR